RNAMPRPTLACTIVGVFAACHAPPAVRLHAHNDYLHAHPLQDALAAGCSSVEADVFLVDGELRVGHERWLLRNGTLQSLYLDPLRARVRSNGGAVQRPGERFWLLIDIKQDGAAVYRRLRAVLAGYRELLSYWRDGVETPGAVTVVLSGDRPVDLVAADRERLCAIDGRVADLDRDPPASLVPWISDAWGKALTWDGDGEPPADQRARLRRLVARAHAQGRMPRFWGAPDQAAVWALLAEEGVDWIGTDRLAACASWRQTQLIH